MSGSVQQLPATIPRQLHFMAPIYSCMVFSNKKRLVETSRFCLEVPARFELANESFADSCLTTWPRYHMK